MSIVKAGIIKSGLITAGIVLKGVVNAIWDDLPVFSTYSFVAAYPAQDDTQNIALEGNVMGLMPKGSITATSAHNTPILALDSVDTYREYAIDDPIWKGGMWVGDGSVTQIDGTFAQCNLANTNEVHYSEKFDEWDTASLVASISVSEPKYRGLDVYEYGDLEANTLHQATNPQSVVSGVNYYISFYIKDIDCGSDVFLKIGGLGLGGVSESPEINLATGAVFIPVTTTRFKSISTEPLGNGWFRVKCHVLAGGTQGFTFQTYDTWGDTSSSGYTGLNRTFKCTGLVCGRVDQDIYIPTAAAAVSIPATEYTFPAANIDSANSDNSITIDWLGDDTDVVTIGAIKFLVVSADNIILSDGISTLSQVITEGKHVVDFTLTATTMSLTVDGTKQTGPYTPIALGLITVNEDFYGFYSKKYASFLSLFSAFMGAETDTQNVNIPGNVMNLMPSGDITATSIHSTPILAKDSNDVFIEFPEDQPIYKGGGYVYYIGRQSEFFASTLWSLASGAIKIGEATIDGVACMELEFTGTSSLIKQTHGTFTETGDVSLAFCKIRAKTGSLSVKIKTGGDRKIISIDETWVQFTGNPYTEPDGNDGRDFGIESNEARTVRVYIAWMQLQDVSTKEDQTIHDEYIATQETAKTFVFNDGLPDVFAQCNIAATNQLKNSTDMTLWNRLNTGISDSLSEPLFRNLKVFEIDDLNDGANIQRNISDTGTSISGVMRYTWFYIKYVGSPTEDVRYLGINGGGVGDASEIASIDFITGNVTMATSKNVLKKATTELVSGGWIKVSLEVLSTNTSNLRLDLKIDENTFLDQNTFGVGYVYKITEGMQSDVDQDIYIPTAGAAASIPATKYTFPLTNLNPSAGTLSFIMDWLEDDTDVITIGVVKLLSVSSGSLILSDGSNTLSHTLVAGHHDVSVDLTATTMTFTVDGVEQSGAYTPIAAGLIIVNEDIHSLQIN